MFGTTIMDNLWWQTLYCLIAFVPIVYWYLTRNYTYWSSQGVKGPKPYLLFGNLIEQLSQSFADLDVARVKQYGKVFGTFVGTQPILSVADNDIVKEVLVKEFNKFSDRRDLKTYHEVVNQNLFSSRGEQWKRVRTITSSTFTSGKMKKLYGEVRKCLQEYIEHLDGVVARKEVLNVKQMHENLTIDVIASCAFATKTNAIKDPNNVFIRNGRQILNFKAYRILPAFLFPKWLNNLLGIKSMFDPTANEWIINLTKHLIDNRRAKGVKNNDFIQLLMDARADDKASDESDNTVEAHYILQDESEKKLWNTTKLDKKSLTDNEILGQCWVFLLAGFETTATALGFMSWLLACNQQIQNRLYEELSEAVDSDGEISYEKLHSLPYLDACISETLRLFPPLSRLERECNTDLKLGNSEIRIKKGQVVEINVYAIHHSPDYWDRAEEFIPERFLPENRHHIIPYTYMPFGNGPRNCIGMRFALMEIKLAMAHMLTRYRFTKIDQTEEKIEFTPLTVLLAPKSVTIGIEKRNE